jgi:hypothetical protein
LFLNMFRASLRPSSGGQTAFSLHMVICRVVTFVMLESRLASCVHCLIVASSWFHIYLLTKGWVLIMDWKCVLCEEIDDFEFVTYMNISLKGVKRWLSVLLNEDKWMSLHKKVNIYLFMYFLA